MMNYASKNPFQITTPEDLSAKDTVDLFINVFTDFQSIIDPGHVFLKGPRGVGKSMMFRYLQADCQCLASECMFGELPFWGVHIPIKSESFVTTELRRFENRHASEMFNEHLMVTHIAMKVFNSLLNNPCAINEIDSGSMFSYYKDCFVPSLLGETKGHVLDNHVSAEDTITNIILLLKNAYVFARQYARRLSYTKDFPDYVGPLYDYQDFLIAILSGLTSVSGFPHGPIYLLIDDAHYLSEIQTRVLNTWIATRTSGIVSLKVSTQYNYKNYYTVTGATIDTPHDYSEIDIVTVYTASTTKSQYRDRITEIISRRLELFNYNPDPALFFPDDAEQEKKVKVLYDAYYAAAKEGKGKGFHVHDDAYRYARPDYIKSLANSRKSSSKYSYAGLDQLINLSSGVIRYFLEPAHEMFAREIARIKESKRITSIAPGVQNEVVRENAESFLFDELENYKHEGHEDAIPKEDVEKLFNLIQGLGGLFRQILLSERSERRVFSVAISDTPSNETEHIFDIGVNLGYFHKSTIGKKDSKSGGRKRLYILNRRLAPIWTLDPNSFAGYLFVKNSLIEDGIKNPDSMLRKIIASANDPDSMQLTLFEESADANDDAPVVVLEGDECE